MQWIVPQLSEQAFEIEADIQIINVQSYPTVGGNWTVYFTTTGTAELTITGIDGTTFGESLPDDLKFLELNNGTHSLMPQIVGNSIIYQNYSSTIQGFESSLVLTPGRHHLEFRFGNDVAYAHNDATFVASTEAVSAGQAESLVINVPTGVQDDDLLLAIVGQAEHNQNNIVTPAGWTLVQNLVVGDPPTQAAEVSVFNRTASSEPASYTFEITPSTSGMVGHMLAYRGVDTNDPINQLGTEISPDGDDGDPAAPSVTTTHDNEMVLYIGFSDDNEVPTPESNYYPTDSGVVGRQATETTSGDNGMALGTADEIRASPGATGIRTFDGLTDEQWGAITLSLNPQTPPTTPTNILCENNNDCDIEVFQTVPVEINGTGSTDAQSDPITYTLEASVHVTLSSVAPSKVTPPAPLSIIISCSPPPACAVSV